MAGSIYGNMFRFSTWGESHGAAIGVVVDGCPAGIELDTADIQKYLNRRKPGQSSITTPRKEADEVEILSGVFEGKTTGTPISMMVRNTSQRSADYSEIASYYRPGHADYTYDEKYGFRDYRGGGRSSGRETIGRVAAGAVAAKVLNHLGIEVRAYTKSIGDISITKVDMDELFNNKLYMPDRDAYEKAINYVENIMKEHDSIGGNIECVVTGMPVGVGEPVFDRLDACLAKGIMSIGSVKGVSIGSGFEAALLRGSENNDEFYYNEDGELVKLTNNSGGILGGISDGSDIIINAAIKPTPSISASQRTVNKSGENIDISIRGRHDPIIVPRAVVVVESMVMVTLVDMLFMNMSSKIDSIVKFYTK